MAKTTINVTHATKVSADALMYQIAETCIAEGITPKRALMNMVQEELKEHNEKIYLSGSSFVSASANPFAFAMQKFLKVFFGKNERLLIGSAYHKAIELAYEHKMATGEAISRFSAIRTIIAYINEEYDKLRDDTKEQYSKKDLYKLTTEYYDVYMRERFNENTPHAVETFMEMATPYDMLTNMQYSEKIRLSGAPDMVLDVNGELVLTDLKTSAKRISGSVVMDEKLSQYKADLKSLNASIAEANKKMEKFVNAEAKLQELRDELAEVELKLADATANGKATKALENKVESLETRHIPQWQDNFEEFTKAKDFAVKASVEVEELEEIIKPLQEIYEQDKANADLTACKKAHGQQLAFYSILYMIKYGKEIKRVRIENLVKTQNPYMQVFEWELNDYELQKAEEEIQNNISLIEMALSGVDPLVLFRLNTSSFIGEDATKLVDDIDALVQQHNAEAMAA